MKSHPEQLEGEIWLTNCASARDFDGLGWKSKRAGLTAYDSEGRLLPGYFPVFARPADEDPTRVAQVKEFHASRS
jgi:hypothetical protein